MSKNDFEPITIDTENVIKELRAVCISYKLSINQIDFNLLGYTTFFRTSAEEEWEELKEDKKELFESDEFLLHETLEIKQQYKIKIFKSDRKKRKKEALPNIVLGANKTLTNVIVTIRKGSNLNTKSGLDKKLIEDINKKKIKARLLVGIREKDMISSVRKIAAQIQVNGYLEEDEKFSVMEFIRPILSSDDEMIYHYRKKINKEDKQGRIDHSRRGFVLPVEKDEVIVEYKKPFTGTPGRDCRGKFLPIVEPKQTINPTLNITEAIAVKEDEESIKYISTKKGYVKDEGGVYDIQEEMDLDGVKFKTTGSIEAGLNSNVTINIKETQEFEDAIGAGMKVETTVLNVQGSVGSNAMIKANKVSIGGQTHKTSQIECKEVEVTVHRGKIIADKAQVKRSEGGQVIADEIHVDTVIGGTLIAKKIYIKTLISNVTLITSDLIDIKNVKGSNNKIIVDPSKIRGLEDKVESIGKKIQDAKKEYATFPKLLNYKKEIIANNKGAVEAVKLRLLELKAKNIKPIEALTKKVQDYQNLINEYNKLLQSYRGKKDEIDLLKRELDEFQSKVFEAKIINRSSWTEFNEICFKLVEPPIEILHSTRDSEISRVITLEQVTENEYRIKRSAEFSK